MKTVKIDGNEFEYASLTPSQQLIADHVVDLERKIRSTQFNLDQLTIGRNAFVEMFWAQPVQE